MQDPLSRRQFILVSALSAAASAFWSACARFQPAPAFTPEERRLVEALADQVIPPDDVPGGKDAGVAEFIDRQLRGPYRRHRQAYRSGLVKIDETSRRTAGAPFAELAFDRQTALLQALEADRVPEGIWAPGEAREFFRLVADHCLQGYYGSPRHGGNRNFASWKMLGLDTPQVLGRVVVKG
ncbi:MAG TPA: gluconate 2-dehydrogenase subunit 3 family protein [Vicinamibacterales bacterium]|nr:gluconate 2-dehydrogenase subunit 3 family protein [Vicinamibacterales bacterium]